MDDESATPQHFTREPWWVVLVGAIVVGLVPIWDYWGVQGANSTGLSLPTLMAVFAAFGALASTVLVARSHIQSTLLANCLLIAGITLIALIVSLISILFSG